MQPTYFQFKTTQIYIMKKLLLLFLVTSSSLITSCSNDDDAKEQTTTQATLLLRTAQQEPVDGIIVYAYDEDTWQLLGDDPMFAVGQAASNSEGEAIFESLDYPTVFNDINNFQNTFRFSAHYQINGNPTTKVKAITISQGDDITETIILD